MRDGWVWKPASHERHPVFESPGVRDGPDRAVRGRFFKHRGGTGVAASQLDLCRLEPPHRDGVDRRHQLCKLDRRREPVVKREPILCDRHPEERVDRPIWTGKLGSNLSNGFDLLYSIQKLFLHTDPNMKTRPHPNMVSHTGKRNLPPTHTKKGRLQRIKHKPGPTTSDFGYNAAARMAPIAASIRAAGIAAAPCLPLILRTTLHRKVSFEHGKISLHAAFELVALYTRSTLN